MEKQDPLLFNVTIAFLILTWIAVGLRIYCRAIVVRSFGIDDKLIIFSLVCISSGRLAPLNRQSLCFIDNLQLTCTGFLIGHIVGIAYGMGQHDEDITLANKRVALKVCTRRYTSPIPSGAAALLTPWKTDVVPMRDV